MDWIANKQLDEQEMEEDIGFFDRFLFASLTEQQMHNVINDTMYSPIQRFPSTIPRVDWEKPGKSYWTWFSSVSPRQSK